jgi:hypothetical protein
MRFHIRDSSFAHSCILIHSNKMTEVAEPETPAMPKMELKMMVLPVMFLLQKQIDMKDPEIINKVTLSLPTRCNTRMAAPCCFVCT